MSLPEPFTPADCDLRGLLFMPLDAQRLRDSDLALFSTGDEFKAAVLLWCASWHRIPAGSLPDDERALCRFSGLVPKAWKKAREGALRGWVKCSDGLLYHEVVAEKAREAWAERQKYRERRDADRERLKGWRERKRSAAETDAGNDAETPNETPNEKRFETRFETLKTVEGQRREGKIEEASASIVAPPEKPSDAKRRRDYPPEFEAAWKSYPHHPGRSSKPGAAAEWRRLPADERASLAGCIERFSSNVATTCGGKGAPDMARWLRDGKHLAWMPSELVADPTPTPPADPWPQRLLQWRVAQYWNSDWGPKPGRDGYQGPPSEDQAA